MMLSAEEIQRLLEVHARSLQDLNLEYVTLTSGTWNEALAPLSRLARSERWKERVEEVGDVPIMLISHTAGVRTSLAAGAHLDPGVDEAPVVERPALQRQDSAIQCGMSDKVATSGLQKEEKSTQHMSLEQPRVHFVEQDKELGRCGLLNMPMARDPPLKKVKAAFWKKLFKSSKCSRRLP